jgi:hypothetical protein
MRVHCIAVDWSKERGGEGERKDLQTSEVESRRMDGIRMASDGMCGIQLCGHRHHPDDGEYGVQLIEI